MRGLLKKLAHGAFSASVHGPSDIATSRTDQKIDGHLNLQTRGGLRMTSKGRSSGLGKLK